MVGILDGILLAAKREILVRSLTLQDLVPVDCRDQLLDFCRLSPRFVNSADEAAHACSGHIAHRNPMFFEPLQDSDVRQSERTSAFKHQTHLGMWRAR